VWAATDKLEGIVLHARGYYQGQQAEPPSAAELIAVVVAVSRLVQAEFGAVEGRGECSLRCAAGTVYSPCVRSLQWWRIAGFVDAFR
jgi:hypothetical protein